MLSVTCKPFMLSVVMLSVVMLSVVMLSVVMLSVVMLSVIMLSVVMLSVVMLSVVMPIAMTTFPSRRTLAKRLVYRTVTLRPINFFYRKYCLLQYK